MKIGSLAANTVLINPDYVEVFTLIRQGIGARDSSGIYIPGAETQTQLEGSIQPATTAERQNLPEGERLSEAISILVLTTNRDLIRPVRRGSVQTDGDIIQTSDGIQWLVQFVDGFSVFGHIEAIATLKEDQDG